ncbi:hypothetical protein Pth03_34720 [Planotetraspora thailandica]|uniref:Transmembrane protein n=1 Tax=Planotetraspora thailandica TaxID=487172 RepID=A0A8J3XYV8_9ACTN|nr:hypothetical protein [Planotetraspora thailandica]GII55083.1 hypothetical protein Pth03_34720 [Planotetraspora thailandica]
MNADGRLSPDQALREIDRLDRHVRRSARGVALLFLIMGLCTMVYWPAMFLGTGWVPVAAGGAWIVLTVASCVYWARIRVHDRLVARINGLVTAAYVVSTMAVFLFGAFVLPHPLAVGWIAALVVISVIAGLPLIYAAWWIRARR